MIISDLMFCAQGVVRDAQTNNISAFSILEEMTPEGFPTLIQQLMVYVRLKRDINSDPSEIECNLKLAVGDKILLEHVFNIDFQDKAKNNLIVNIGGIVIPVTGELETSIWYNDTLLNKYIVVINEPRQQKVSAQTS